jgi:hypothetical protein
MNKWTKDATSDAVRAVKEEKNPFAEELRRSRTLCLVVREYLKNITISTRPKKPDDRSDFPFVLETQNVDIITNVDLILFRLTSGGLL